MLQRLRALASDSVVYGLSGVVTRFLTIWLVPVYTRLFTPADYGVLALVTSTVAVIGIFVVLALDNSAARWYWDTEDDTDRKRSVASGGLCQVATASVFAAALWAGAEPLAAHVVDEPAAAPYFRLAAPALPLGQLGIVLQNWLRMRRRAVATMVYTLGTSLVQIGATLLLVAGWRWGLRGVFVGQLVAQAVGAVAAVVLLGDWLHPRHFAARRLGAMLRFALPLIPAALAVWVVAFADRYFVQRFASTDEVGLYSVGNSLAQGIVMLTAAFQQAWGPFALSIHRQPDAQRTYAHAFLAYAIGTALVSAALALFAPEVILLLATPRYLGAAPVVGFLALAYVATGMTYVAATGPAIAKRSGPTAVAVTAAALLNIALNAVLVPRLGKVGAAVATLASQALTPVYLFWRAQAIYPIPYRFGAGLGTYALALALMLIAPYLPAATVAGVLGKLALLALFVPLLVAFDLLTRERVRAAIALVRPPARSPARPHAG